jgi:hypothetical protein
MMPGMMDWATATPRAAQGGRGDQQLAARCRQAQARADADEDKRPHHGLPGAEQPANDGLKKGPRAHDQKGQHGEPGDTAIAEPRAAADRLRKRTDGRQKGPQIDPDKDNENQP